MCSVMANLAGYSFSLLNYEFFAAFTALMSLISAITAANPKQKISSRVNSVFSSILPLLSVINGIFYLVRELSFTITACTVICLICSVVICIKNTKLLSIKIIFLSVAGVILISAVFLFPLFLLAKTMVTDTVLENIPSPNMTYYAEVIDNDQGALGGNTKVFISETQKSKINLLIFFLEKQPKLIYTGDWDEYEYMNIYWKNDNTLIINGNEYKTE